MLFTAEQTATLHSVLDRLIPEDDFPSAWEAGVGNYIWRLLETDQKHLLDPYRLGLDALEAEAQARWDHSFAHATAEDQDTLLSQMEAGQVTLVWPVAPGPFLRMLVHHTAEGYYADPGQGGNQNAISWDMIGFVPQSQHTHDPRT